MCVSDCEAARVLHCKDRWDSDFEDSGPTETNQKLSRERFREKASSKDSKNEMITKQYMHWDALLYKWTFGPHASPFFFLHTTQSIPAVSQRGHGGHSSDVFWLAGRPGTCSLYASEIDGNTRGTQSGWHDSVQGVPEAEQLMIEYILYIHIFIGIFYISSCKCHRQECLISLLSNVFQITFKIHKIYWQKRVMNGYSSRFAIRTVLWDDCQLSIPAVVVFIDVMLCNRQKQTQRYCFRFCFWKNLIGQDIKCKLH